MNKCKKCNGNALTENQQDGMKIVSCTNKASCGYVEVRDKDNRRLLTDSAPAGNPRTLLG